MPKSSNFFCSLESKAGNDELTATATHFKKLLLIEYRLPLEEDALKESEIPHKVKLKIKGFLDSNPHSRVLLIRNPDLNSGDISIFGINSGEQNTIKKKLIARYDDIMDFELDELFSNGPNLLHHDFLYLICTNGNKDRCCAKFGIPIYNEFRKHRTQNTWQCSHLGGHRFAPTMLTLPSCTNYGRLSEEDVIQVIRAEESNKLFLNKIRGQAFLRPMEQAATIFLRNKLDASDLNVIHIESFEPLGPDRARIGIRNVINNRNYEIIVSQKPSEYFGFISCNATERSFSTTFNIESYTEIPN